MIYKKNQNGTETELKEISFEEAFPLAGTGALVFDSPIEEMNFYKEVLKKYPPAPVDDSKKESKYSDMLPFLDDEDLHEIVLSIVNEEENSKYKDLDFEELFPYLNEEDSDFLFAKGISSPNLKINPADIAPFVSEKALTAFVDEYLKGNYQDVDVNDLYPFMKSSDIKRLFMYFLEQKKENEENGEE
ncbi:MAG: hypothetical protein K2K48_06925 [Anaeroplasmataceae bacterium]|nr:hypothetical protein [Anaeroplasmataceae bacterium]MDE6415133.1 hypothetical protein [Anaeroplasmataceae bacterium]